MKVEKVTNRVASDFHKLNFIKPYLQSYDVNLALSKSGIIYALLSADIKGNTLVVKKYSQKLGRVVSKGLSKLLSYKGLDTVYYP